MVHTPNIFKNKRANEPTNHHSSLQRLSHSVLRECCLDSCEAFSRGRGFSETRAKDLESETFNFAEVDRMSGFTLKSIKINRGLPTKGKEAGLGGEGKK